MARRGTKKGRATFASAKMGILPLSQTPSRATMRARNLTLFPDLTEIEDRRRWHPLGQAAPAHGLSKPRHRLKMSEPLPRNRDAFRDAIRPKVSPSITAFSVPLPVAICVRRQRRKEVLHALNKTGKVGQKRPRRSEYSSVSCRG